MVQEEIVPGSLLYHEVHGLCRVDRLIKQNQSGKEVLSYSLLPKIASKMKVRFVIAASDVETSGFHSLVSIKEANQILDYLKTKNATLVTENKTWGLAQTILSFSHDEFAAKDQRKRQILERSAKGLVGELAFVLKWTTKETAEKLLKNLETASKINASIRVALTNAGKD